MSRIPSADPTNPAAPAYSEADWARWAEAAGPILASARRALGGSTATPRAVLAAIVRPGIAEARSLARILGRREMTLARFADVLRDSLAARLTAGTVARLGGRGSDQVQSPDDLDVGDRDALARRLAVLVRGIARLVESIRSGRTLLEDSENGASAKSALIASEVQDMAEAVAYGRQAEDIGEADVDAADRLWKKYAPDWATDLLDSEIYEGDDEGSDEDD